MGIYKDLNVIERGSNVPFTRIITDADIALAAHMSGETIFLAITGSTDIAITLPAPRLGLNFKFINTLSPSGTGDAVITSAGGNDTIVTQSIGGTNTASTATITVTTFGELNNGDKINLIAADGAVPTGYDFVCGDQSSVEGTWESTTSNNATATNIMNVINTSSGPAGTRFSATVVDNVVTVTQNTSGSGGNTTVTLTDSGTAGMTSTSFTGGYSGADNLLADNVTIEAASLGGEWIEFASDANFWYSRVTKSVTTAVSMNG